MGLAVTKITVTPEEYLDGELLTDVRHEYLGGDIYAMGGASDAHNVIAGNIFALFRNHLRGGGPCRAYITDMKVRIRIREDDYFYYPDVFVACQHGETSVYYKEHPAIIVEVLSPSTDRIDRREKFLAYDHIPTFETYVLVEQARVHVEVSRRTPDGWKSDIHESLDDAFDVEKIGTRLTLAQIYEDVTFSTAVD